MYWEARSIELHVDGKPEKILFPTGKDKKNSGMSIRTGLVLPDIFFSGHFWVRGHILYWLSCVQAVKVR